MVESNKDDPERDVDAGIRAYTRVLREGLPFTWAIRNRGVLREVAGDLAGARRDYDRAITARPEWARALTSRAGLREALGDLRGAREDYDRAVACDPPWATAFCNRRRAMAASATETRSSDIDADTVFGLPGVGLNDREFYHPTRSWRPVP